MIDKIRFDDFKMTGIEFDNTELNYGQLNLFAGQNNSGKTAVFKTAWLMGTALVTYAAMIPMRIPNLDQMFKTQLETLVKGTFSDLNDISGAVEISGEFFKMSVVFLPGAIVESFNIEVSDPEKMIPGNISVPRYNSKDARTFSQFERYLKIKTKFGILNYKNDEDILEMLEFYKLYDIMWFEGMIPCIDQHTSGEKSLMPAFNRGCKILGIDPELSRTIQSGTLEFREYRAYVKTGDNMVRLSTYSEGSQSVFMMTMFMGDIPPEEEEEEEEEETDNE